MRVEKLIEQGVIRLYRLQPGDDAPMPPPTEVHQSIEAALLKIAETELGDASMNAISKMKNWLPLCLCTRKLIKL